MEALESQLDDGEEGEETEEGEAEPVARACGNHVCMCEVTSFLHDP